jgi:YVTN family beta-propeller protein
VRTGSYCQAVAVNSTTNKIYVANNFGHSVTVIDGATNTATTLRVGQGPRAIVVNPVTNKIYTANYGSKDVTEIDGATNAITSVPTGKHPWAVAVDSRANKTYVVNEDSASVPSSTAPRARRRMSRSATSLAVRSQSRRTRPTSSPTPEHDGGDRRRHRQVTKTLPLATHPSAIAVNPKTNQIYIANQTTASVLVLDGKTNAITATKGRRHSVRPWPRRAAANQLHDANQPAGMQRDPGTRRGLGSARSSRRMHGRSSPSSAWLRWRSAAAATIRSSSTRPGST